MPISDARGNLMTASGPEPVALFDATVDSYLGFRADAGDRLRSALAADPGLVLAHCLRGYFMMLFGQRAMVPRAERALAAARQAAGEAAITPRETAHLTALAAWIAGDFAGATAAWDAIAAEHPRDVLALKLAQYGHFYAGDSRRMDHVLTRAASAWSADTPGYGYVLGCRAFAFAERGEYGAAEFLGRAAIDLNPADIWAAHAVAHVFEMTDRPREGIGWIASLEARWSGCNNFAYHLYWHRCLFWLELEAFDRVLELYDHEVRPQPTDDLLDIANAVSLLWRLEQSGIDVGNRWEELAANAQAHADDHLLVFGDLHYLMALAAAGGAGDAARLVDNLSRFAADSGESQAAVAREPGLMLADAVLAHRRGDHRRVVDRLLPALSQFHRIGGSHAQRDLFVQILIDSALFSCNFDVAKLLISQRLAARPANAWGLRQARRLDRGTPADPAKRQIVEA